MHRCGRAFTLIELLVVISAIAMLIAILLPALAKARNAAQAIKGLANVRSIQTGVFLYASDAKSSSPYLNFPVDNTGGYSGKYTGVYTGIYTWEGIPVSGAFRYNTWATVLYDMQYNSYVRTYWSPARDMGHLRNGRTLESSIPSMIPRDMTSNYLDWYNFDFWRFVGFGMVGYQASSDGAIDPNQGWVVNIPNVDQSRAKLSETISLVDAWDANYSSNDSFAGFYKAGPQPWTPTLHGLFSYDDRVIRSYWDGHAVCSDGASIGWNADDRAGGYPSLYGGGYGGSWTLGAWTWKYSKPWYTAWAEYGSLD